MSRYVDVDDVANAIYHHFPSVRTMADARSVIDEAPTIDAVSVVRCKECKHASDNKVYGCICNHFNDNDWDYHRMYADDFCSYGEREGE